MLPEEENEEVRKRRRETAWDAGSAYSGKTQLGRQPSCRFCRRAQRQEVKRPLSQNYDMKSSR
eukprot:2716578-Heterocapsa_arctica.AAC.1